MALSDLSKLPVADVDAAVRNFTPDNSLPVCFGTMPRDEGELWRDDKDRLTYWQSVDGRVRVPLNPPIETANGDVSGRWPEPGRLDGNYSITIRCGRKQWTLSGEADLDALPKATRSYIVAELTKRIDMMVKRVMGA